MSLPGSKSEIEIVLAISLFQGMRCPCLCLGGARLGPRMFRAKGTDQNNQQTTSPKTRCFHRFPLFQGFATKGRVNRRALRKPRFHPISTLAVSEDKESKSRNGRLQEPLSDASRQPLGAGCGSRTMGPFCSESKKAATYP